MRYLAVLALALTVGAVRELYIYRQIFYNYLLISVKICENLPCILRKNFVGASYMYLNIASILFNGERWKTWVMSSITF